MKNWNKYPVAVLLLLSSILFAAAGMAGRNTVYASYDRQDIMTPAVSFVFQGLKDGVYPWSLLKTSEAEAVLNEGQEVSEGEEKFAADAQQTVSGNNLYSAVPEESGEAGAVVPSVSGNDPVISKSLGPVLINGADGIADANEQSAAESVSGNGILIPDMGMSPTGETDSLIKSADLLQEGQGTENGEASAASVPAEERTYEFTSVGEDYFADALFIGDSRTVGLQEYGKLNEAQYFAATSLSIYNVFQNPKKIAVVDGKKVTIEEALHQKQFKKIYLMLGINELGTGSVEYFIKAYADVVIRIRQLQPDAILFIQGIMRVGSEKNASDPVFNNTRINERNASLSMFADNRNIFYLEINDAVCDESGNLVDGYTFDQIHLKAKYYQLWKDYLLGHGIVK